MSTHSSRLESLAAVASPRSQPFQVLALPGSLRSASYNRHLLAAASEHAPAGLEITLFDGLASVPLFNEDLDDPAGGPEGC